jgi:hypothetical protein
VRKKSGDGGGEEILITKKKFSPPPNKICSAAAAQFNSKSIIFILLVPKTWNTIPLDPTIEKMVQIDSGITNAVWAINIRDAVYMLKDFNKWIYVPTNQKYITAGESGVWAVGNKDQVQLRLGISDKLPEGKQWYQISGKMKQIDSGPLGILCGITVEQKIDCRTGVSLIDPKGNGWSTIPFEKKPKHISCGEFGCWVVTTSNKVRIALYYFKLSVLITDFRLLLGFTSCIIISPQLPLSHRLHMP